MFKLPDKIYDALKELLTIIIPGALSAYMALVQTLEFYEVIGKGAWPNPGMVTAVTAIVCTFLGIVFKISTSGYYKHQELKRAADEILVSGIGGSSGEEGTEEVIDDLSAFETYQEVSVPFEDNNED